MVGGWYLRQSDPARRRLPSVVPVGDGHQLPDVIQAAQLRKAEAEANEAEMRAINEQLRSLSSNSNVNGTGKHHARDAEVS